MPRLRPLVLFAALLVPLSALATVVLSMSMEEMTARAPLVVHGIVNVSEPGWDEPHAKIWTWTEVVVKDTLKGDARATVLVKQPGGVVGPLGMSVAGAATFTAGEEVVLFLEPANDEPGAWVPVAMSSSKVTLEDRFGVKVARRDLAGLVFARPGKTGVAEPVDERETLGTADAFLARIHAAVKK
jgi:hypothetical protein